MYCVASYKSLPASHHNIIIIEANILIQPEHNIIIIEAKVLIQPETILSWCVAMKAGNIKLEISMKAGCVRWGGWVGELERIGSIVC